MRLRAERDALAKVVAQVGRVARPGPAGVAVVHLTVEGDKVDVSATDLDVSMRTTMDVAGGEAGTVAVGAKTLSNALASLRPGAVEVEVDGSRLRLSVGPSTAKVWTVTGERAPDVTMGPDLLSVPGPPLLAMAERVAVCASRDDARPILTAVLWEPTDDSRLRMVATDSYRLAWGEVVAVPWHTPALVPARAMAELARVAGDGPVSVEADELSIAFGAGPTVIRSRLVEGKFPDYRRLIDPRPSSVLTCATDDLADAVKRMDPHESGEPVRLALTATKVALSSVVTDRQAKADELDCTWTGDDLTVGFNAGFLADLLLASGGETAELAIVDSLKPTQVTNPADSTWFGLLMPVRLS